MTRILEAHAEAALIRAHDKVQRNLQKLNKLAVGTVNDQDAIKAIDEARIEHMKSLNAALNELEQAGGKQTLGQRLRGTVKAQELAAQ